MRKSFQFVFLLLLFSLPGVLLFAFEGAIDARGFEIEEREGWTLLRVALRGGSGEQEYTYCLYPRGADRPKNTGCALLVQVPVERIVVFSTSYIAALDILGEISAICGIDNKAYIYSSEVLSRIEDGTIAQIGEYPNIDKETLLLLNPDLIMMPVYGGGSGAFQELESLGFPVVVNNDWFENTPLGRAEWIKYIAVFLDKLDEASGYYDTIRSEYNTLVEKVRHQAERPSVLINTSWQGVWYLPAGDSYQARFIADAGGDYCWREKPGTGSLALDFESVYSRAAEADVWMVHTGSWKNLRDSVRDDPRYGSFESFVNGRVYNFDTRIRASGANDYWESGPVQPHFILEDLVRIFHPGLLEAGEFHYYRRLD